MSIITKIRIGADGQPQPDDSPDRHVAILLPQVGWMITPTVINKQGASQHKLIEAAKKVDVLGFNDWELASVELVKLVTDHSRYNPALDPQFFYDIPIDWIWTSTECEWSRNKEGVASSAWSVNSYRGDVNYDLRHHNGFALAARRSGQ